MVDGEEDESETLEGIPVVPPEPEQVSQAAESRGKPADRERAYHHGNLRQALLDAAIEIIGEEGAAGFQLRAVARRAGVSPAAPYRHFRDKADLLAEVGTEVARELAAKMKEEVAAAASGSPIDRFRAQGVAFVKFAVARPAHFRVLNLPEVARRYHDEVGLLMGSENLLADAVKVTRDAGQLHAGANDATVVLTARSTIYGLARMLVDGHLGDELPSEEEAERLAVAVTSVLGHGLIPRQ